MDRLRPLAAALALAATAAAAQDLPADIVTASLREGWRTEAGTQMVALDLVLAPGWKTYWRAPGEAGIPPEFDWTGSENIGAVTFHWPRPEVFDLNGMQTFGYRKRLVLPIEIRPADAGRPLLLKARVDLGVCAEVCVPATVEVAAEVRPGAAADPVIRAALADAPEPASAAGLTAARCAAEPIRDGLRLTTLLAMPPLGPEEIVVVELADTSVWVSQAATSRAGGELSATADLVPADAKPFALDRSTIRITVFAAAGRMVEVQGCTG